MSQRLKTKHLAFESFGQDTNNPPLLAINAGACSEDALCSATTLLGLAQDIIRQLEQGPCVTRTAALAVVVDQAQALVQSAWMGMEKPQ